MLSHPFTVFFFFGEVYLDLCDAIISKNITITLSGQLLTKYPPHSPQIQLATYHIHLHFHSI